MPNRKPPPRRPKGTPKTGGRKKGTPNRATVEAKAFFTRVVNDRVYQRNFLKAMRDRTAGPMEAIAWYYAAGKPKDRIELGADATLHDLIREAVKGPPMPPP